MVKQVIVMRKDLKMRRGKEISQGSHASMKVFFDKMYNPDSGSLAAGITYNKDDIGNRTMKLTPEELEWVDGIFTKICLYVNSEAELDDLYNQAKGAGLNCSMIVDSGLTEFHGVATKTCIAIGPNEAEKIDLITGKLPLL